MIKVGLFGIGLDTYWPQFEGLLERLEGYQQQIATKMESFGADVVNVGLVDSPSCFGYSLVIESVRVCQKQPRVGQTRRWHTTPSRSSGVKKNGQAILKSSRESCRWDFSSR